MPSKLVIVESPAKIKKLQSFLGSDYSVMASYGHFRDLDPKKLSVHLDDDFKPDYSVSSGKQNVVRELKSKMKNCQTVYLASDFDREGEAIAWHIKEVLKLKSSNAKRIVFTEITKTAILHAIDNPTTINVNMFYAQQARRVLDRIIGYLISPILWKQIQSSYTRNKSLSAGRVQSVLVKLVMEREEEIKKFESSPYFKISGSFAYPTSQKDSCALPAELNKEKEITTLEEAQKILEFCQEADFWIDDVKTRHTKRQPPLPFITSSLQQEASQKLGMSPKDTMSIAQKLYEKGKITYMRTDSLVLSEEAHSGIKSKVNKEFGSEFYQKNKKTCGNDKQKHKQKGKDKEKGKDNNAQEAHEACRPTNFEVHSVESDSSISYRENRLYKLIWSRTMMSQMKPAECDITSIKIKMKQGKTTHKYHFMSKKEVITFLGYLMITEFMKNNHQVVDSEGEGESEDEGISDNNKHVNQNLTEELVTVEIQKGKDVTYQKIQAEEKLTKPPQPHYHEASLIKKLDELGIGRPSTYATMISNVQDRNYVEKKTVKAQEKKMNKLVLYQDNITTQKGKVKIGGEKDKLFPTNLGEIVNKFLLEHFPEILDYKFTAEVESKLDAIAQGNIAWQEVVRETYEKIKPKLEEMNVSLTAEKDKYRRELGTDPQTGDILTTYIGKFGPVVQCKNEVTDKMRFAPLGDLKMETVTLEQALKLFMYPKSLGSYRKKEVMLCKGQYGFYLKYNKKNISIPSNVNSNPEEGGNIPSTIQPENLSLQEAKKIITDFNNTEKGTQTVEYEGQTISIKTGKFGPYFNYQGKNYSIYKTYDVANLTPEDIKKIMEYKKKQYSGKKPMKKEEKKSPDESKDKDKPKDKTKKDKTNVQPKKDKPKKDKPKKDKPKKDKTNDKEKTKDKENTKDNTKDKTKEKKKKKIQKKKSD
jgi:DNA topoisomerase-1